MSSQIQKRQHVEWNDLPTELLAAIAKYLTSVTDYSSFRGVCNSWRSAAILDNFDTQFPRLPLLLYFTKEGKRISTNLVDLESNIRKRNNLVPPDRDHPYLSCSGWILRSSRNGDVHLTNIVWRTKINLPNWTTFPGYSQKDDNFGLPVITKMVLSGSPMVNADMVIMVIWGRLNQLGFCRPGDKSWTIFSNHLHFFTDVIYHHGKLYAVDTMSTVVECDIHATKIVHVFAFPEYFPDNGNGNGYGYVNGYCYGYGNDYFRHNYLVVESSEKFLIVSRYISSSSITFRFRIFEIELKDGIRESGKEINDLGNRCLFLGLNSSICVERSGELGNSIYFTNTIKSSQPANTGVYRLSNNGSIQQSLVSKLGIDFYSPPIWILPTF